jgi:hypothetical protein
MPTALLDIAAPLACETPRPHRQASELLVHAVSGACVAGLTVAAGALAVRRAEGMLAAPLSSAPLFVVGTCIASLALLAQYPHVPRIVAARTRRIHAADVAAFGVPLAIAVLLAAVVTLPGTSFGGAVLLWLPLAVGQAALVLLHRRRFVVRGVTASETALDDVNKSVACKLPRADVLGGSNDECLADDTMQQWTRRTVDGTDVLEGMARAYFTAGSRAANLHVGICPPFAKVPEVFAETADGPTATVKVAEALPFGLRLEVRLSEAGDADASVVVAVVARA